VLFGFLQGEEALFEKSASSPCTPSSAKTAKKGM